LEDIVSVENLEKKITWSSRLVIVRRASYPSVENICKLKTLNEGMEPDGLMDADESECKENWIACVQDRGKWKEVFEKAKIFN
jgi:hypothetical protein